MGTKYKGSAAERRALNAYITFARAHDTLAGELSRQLSSCRLTITQFGVLDALHHLGQMQQSRLAEKILCSSGNLTTVVENLRRRGLVERNRNPEDRRSIIISLTDNGRELFLTALPGHIAAIRSRLERLEKDELKKLREMMRRVGS